MTAGDYILYQYDNNKDYNISFVKKVNQVMKRNEIKVNESHYVVEVYGRYTDSEKIADIPQILVKFPKVKENDLL
jgi:hypothetical protein